MFLAKKGVKVKRVKIIFACVIAILVCFGLVACQKTIKTNRNNEKILDSGETDERASVLSIKNGKVDGLDIYLEVSPDIELIDLSGMIKTTKNCSWKLYAAPAVTEDLANATKTIAPSKGNNIYFVVVTSANGKVDRTYRLNVFKNYYATLTFTFDNAVVAQEEVLTHTVYNGLGPVCRDPAFISWDCQGQYIESERTFEAKVKQYDVTFLSSTGEIIEKQSVLKNRLVDRPQDPVSEDGLIFSGWYAEIKWDFDNDKVLKNIILTESWRVKQNYDILYFGKVKRNLSNSTTENELKNLAGKVPTERNPGNWKKDDNDKWYIKITYNDIEFTGLYSYGGKISWTYEEIIEWKIVKKEDGKAFVVSRTSVEKLPFDENGNNNYARSTIRAWLNNEFYNNSFRSEELRKRILNTEVDNSLASTMDETNENVCENTYDKVFLLSLKEVKDNELSFYRYNYYDVMLRTPSATNKDEVKTARRYDSLDRTKASYKNDIYPALWISL